MKNFNKVHYSDETGQIFMTSSRDRTIASVVDGAVTNFDLNDPGNAVGEWDNSPAFSRFPAFRPMEGFRSETFLSTNTQSFDCIRFLPFWVVEELAEAGVIDFGKFRRQLEDRIRKDPLAAFMAMRSMIL